MSNNTIIQIFDYIADKLGVVIDWSQENLQPYLADLFDRWVSYELASTWVMTVVLAVIIVIAIIYPIVVIKMRKKAKAQKRDNIFCEYWSNADYVTCFDITIRVGMVLAILAIVAAISLSVKLIPDLIKLYTIPEIALYEMVFD